MYSNSDRIWSYLLVLITFGFSIVQNCGYCTFWVLVIIFRGVVLIFSKFVCEIDNSTRRFLPRRFKRVGSSQLVSEPKFL